MSTKNAFCQKFSTCRAQLSDLRKDFRGMSWKGHSVQRPPVLFRGQTEEIVDSSSKPKKRLKRVEQDEWHVLIKDHHDGYISWDRFETNQNCIPSNRRSTVSPGTPRKGGSLLQGLVVCGRCGRRMSIAYGKNSRYRCAKAGVQTGASVCQGFGAQRLEQTVEKIFLESLSPLGMEAMIEAAKLYAEEVNAQRRQWDHSVERARYDEVSTSHLTENPSFDTVWGNPDSYLLTRE